MGTLNEEDTEFYVDEANEHRWRVRARNGRIVGASSEGFSSKDMARKNATNLGVMLTLPDREKITRLCKQLEDLGYKLHWKPLETDDDGNVVADAHWEILAP